MNDQPPAVCLKIPLRGVEVGITGSKHNNYTTACLLIELELAQTQCATVRTKESGLEAHHLLCNVDDVL